MVHPDSHRVSRAPWYSGTETGRNRAFHLRGCHPLRRSFPGPLARLVLDDFPACAVLRPTTPREPKPSRFGLFRVRSPLLTESLICFLFLRVLRWFTSPGLLLPAYEFSRGSSDLTRKGLPHSEIPGSKPVCGSPRLIAACHVLHRFSAPRHPPSTLSSLTIKYLRRESFSFYPTLLSKIVITADQKVPRLGGTSSSALPTESPDSPVAFRPVFGGAERNRTADLRLAKPPLSQLSYSPT